MDDQIRPFRIEVPQTDLEDLHDRLQRTRWPDAVPGVDGDDWARGIPPAEVQGLAAHWRTDFDWTAAQARLNEVLPQFTTEIDGQQIHFAHVRSPRADALPLLVTHGFPSSFAEFLRLVPLLVDPAEGPAFHVVAPSLPGYGFSTPLTSTGWTMSRTSAAWVELMRRLGYERYGVHGGDIGGGVSGTVAGLDPEHVVGVHIVTDPLTAANVATFMPGLADGLDADDPVDQQILQRMEAFRREGSGYLAIQNSRPYTIGYGLTDSPALQLAWIAEKFREWTDVRVDRDLLLTIVSLYWFTRSGASAAQTLYEQAHSFDWGPPGNTPQGWAVFSADATVPRLMKVPEGTRWTEYDRGMHFPAMEVPELLARDLQDFFGALAAAA